jgi:hypothetical protein
MEKARCCAGGGTHRRGRDKFCFVWKHRCEARVVTPTDLPLGRARCSFVATDLEEDISNCHRILLVSLQLKVVDLKDVLERSFQAFSAIGSAPNIGQS